MQGQLDKIKVRIKIMYCINEKGVSVHYLSSQYWSCQGRVMPIFIFCLIIPDALILEPNIYSKLNIINNPKF